MKEAKCNPHSSRISEQVLLFCFSLKTVVRDGHICVCDRPFLVRGRHICVCDGHKMARYMPRLFCIIVYQEAAKNAIFTGRSKRIVDTYIIYEL